MSEPYPDLLALFSLASQNLRPVIHLERCHIIEGYVSLNTSSSNGTTKNGRLRYIIGKSSQFFFLSLREILTSSFTDRPVLNGRRVPPSEFSDFRRTHVFRYPSCLCAMESPDGSAVTESVIFMSTTPGVAGEYVAACAKKKCKYFGVFFSKHFEFTQRLILALSVLIERFYSRYGLPVQAYPLRGMDLFIILSSSPISIPCFSYGRTTPGPYRFRCRRFRAAASRRQRGRNHPDTLFNAHSSPR